MYNISARILAMHSIPPCLPVMSSVTPMLGTTCSRTKFMVFSLVTLASTPRTLKFKKIISFKGRTKTTTADQALQ